MAKTKRKVSKPKQAALPLPKQPPPAPVVKLQFNQAVTLKSDKSFLGYVFSQLPDGSEYLVSIKEPGRTGLRGCKFFKVSNVIPADAKQIAAAADKVKP